MAKQIILSERLKNWRKRIENKAIKQKIADHFTQEMAAQILKDEGADTVSTYINWESGRRGQGLKASVLNGIVTATSRKNDEQVLATIATWEESVRFRKSVDKAA